MNLKQVVSSEDSVYTKTHEHQLLVNNLYAEEKTAIHATNIVRHHFTTYYQKEIISLEKFRGYQLICENCETFPPQTICNIQLNNTQLYSH